jgi:hypothetical protein
MKLRPHTILIALTLLPMIPYVVILAAKGVPRFDLVADLAWMEYDTRHVFHGDTLLGLSSRFGWSHPGPLLFYAAAPFEAALGPVGLYAATCVLTGGAITTIVYALHRFASRHHAVVASFVLLVWQAAFGNVLVNPWVRTVVVLPLFAHVVLTALFMRGTAEVAILAVCLGCVAAHTHVSTLPAVAIVSAVGVASFAIARRRRPLDRRERAHVVVAALLFVLSSVPPFVEQLRGHDGNLSKLAVFFAHRSEPYKPLAAALTHGSNAGFWIVRRVLGADLPRDSAIAFGMRWDEVPLRVQPWAVVVSIARSSLMLVSIVIARRRKDFVNLALLSIALVSDALSILAIGAIVGEVQFSLLFWITAPVAVGWMGVLSTLTKELPARSALVALAIVSIGALALQTRWLARHPFAPASYPEGRATRQSVYASLRERLDRTGAAPVVHLEGAWPIAVSMILELDRDRVPLCIGERERWGFPGARGSCNHPLHVWFGDRFSPLPSEMRACVETIASAGELDLYGASGDVTKCTP